MLPSRRQRRLGSSLPTGGLLARAGVTLFTLFSGSSCLGVLTRTEVSSGVLLRIGGLPYGLDLKTCQRSEAWGPNGAGTVALGDHPPRAAGGIFTRAPTRAPYAAGGGLKTPPIPYPTASSNARTLSSRADTGSPRGATSCG